LDTIADILRLLAVDTRIEIIESLKAGPMCVCAIARAVGVSQSAVSQHLRLLKAAGVVTVHRRGQWIHYSLEEKALAAWRTRLSRLCDCNCIRGRRRKGCCGHTDNKHEKPR